MGGWLRMYDMRFLFVALVLVGSTAHPAETRVAPLECRWVQKHQCEPGSGCKALKITTFARVDLIAKQFSRCDRIGCDVYDANITGGGSTFMNIDVTGRGVFVKIAPDYKSTEVVSLGNVVLISQGTCQQIRSPKT